MLFVQPARPGEAIAPATDAAAESRPRWPLSVAVIDVTGAVKAVIGDVTAVNRGHDPCAGRDRHRAGSARRGRFVSRTVPGPTARALSARLAEVARSRYARLLDCSGNRSVLLKSPHSLDALPVASLLRPRRATGTVEAVTGEVTVAVAAVTRGRDPVPAVTTVAGGLPKSSAVPRPTAQALSESAWSV